jgi:quercetin dioxygenase-like cupin family protein
MSSSERRMQPTGTYFTKARDVRVERITQVEDVKEDGVLTVKPMMVGADLLFLEAFKGKGLHDPLHRHDDHESIGYCLSGKLRLVIGGQEFVAEPGDVWLHPRGVEHFSEALEDTVQLEIKSPPTKTWISEPD